MSTGDVPFFDQWRVSMSSIATSSSVVSPAHGESCATGRGRFARVGLATVAAATLANTLVYFAGGALVAYDPRFLPLANVSGAIVFTLPAAIVAVLVYAALLRFARKPARTFTIIAAAVFVVTVIPDFTYIPTVPGATVAQTAVLVLMHIVAASVIVRMLTSFARPQAR
jgi:FlaA1/EpsC-like NDP-sugar epimerase